MRRALGTVTFSRLMRLSRELPGARAFHLSRVDYVGVALKEPTVPLTPKKPEDAGPDWRPPQPTAPAFFRFDGANGSVTVTPADDLAAGQVEIP